MLMKFQNRVIAVMQAGTMSQGFAAVTLVELQDEHVTIESTEYVRPSQATAHQIFHLSNIDLALLFPVETVYFFAPQPGKPIHEVAHMVKRALAQLLVPYHFLAGRLTPTLHLRCNAAGALFRSASCARTLSQLGDLAQPNPSFSRLVACAWPATDATEAPLLTLQVTTFMCGGFSLGLVTCHALMDGISAADFLLDLCHMCAARPLERTPVFDRSALQPARNDHAQAPQLNLPTYEREGETGVWASFSLTRDQLQRLKTNARARSTFQALVAHLWHARTRAVHVSRGSSNASASTSLLFAVDLRRRLQNPPLPRGFVGNAVATALAKASVGELIGERLTCVARRVSSALAAVTEEHVRGSMEAAPELGCESGDSIDVCVSAWWKLPLYELDLGWGCPVFAGPVVNHAHMHLLSRFALVLPHNASSAGAHVWLCLSPAQLQHFGVFFSSF